MTDFSRLCFTGIVCALFAAISAQIDHSDSWPENELWFVGFFAAVVSLWKENFNFIHILVFIFILIRFCCCPWCLTWPCTTLAQSSPSTPSSPLTVIIVTVQKPIWGLGFRSRSRYGVVVVWFPMCGIPKPATFPPDTCPVTWYLSPAAWSYPVLCMLRDLLWSFAVPSEPPDPLPLLPPSFPVTCLW